MKIKLKKFENYKNESPYMRFYFYGKSYRIWLPLRSGENDNFEVFRVTPRPNEGPKFIILAWNDYRKIIMFNSVEICSGIGGGLSLSKSMSYDEAKWKGKPRETALRLTQQQRKNNVSN